MFPKNLTQASVYNYHIEVLSLREKPEAKVRRSRCTFHSFEKAKRSSWPSLSEKSWKLVEERRDLRKDTGWI